jgi:KDO2-lipid IV(A) lauroyltransferase
LGKALIELIEFGFFWLARAVVGNLPFPAAGHLGSFLGTSVFRLTGFRKTLTMDNLRHAFPEMKEHEVEEIALGAYRNYGISLMEMIWASRQPPSRLCDLVNLQNREVFERMFAKQKGVVIVSAHFGSWELLIHGARLQIGMPLNIIVQRQRNQWIDRLIDRGRRRHGNSTIPMGPSAREALSVLRNRGVIAALADQSGPKESLFVDFLGRPAATHRGVAAFSLKTGSQIVMALSRRRPDGTYDVVFEEVDQHDIQSYSEENISELTRRHVAVLERHIRRSPDHWLWMHKRWKHTDFHSARHDSPSLS